MQYGVAGKTPPYETDGDARRLTLIGVLILDFGLA